MVAGSKPRGRAIWIAARSRAAAFNRGASIAREVRFRVRSMAIPPHATTLPRPSLRLKARGFDHPRRGH